MSNNINCYSNNIFCNSNHCCNVNMSNNIPGPNTICNNTFYHDADICANIDYNNGVYTKASVITIKNNAFFRARTHIFYNLNSELYKIVVTDIKFDKMVTIQIPEESYFLTVYLGNDYPSETDFFYVQAYSDAISHSYVTWGYAHKAVGMEVSNNSKYLLD